MVAACLVLKNKGENGNRVVVSFELHSSRSTSI